MELRPSARDRYQKFNTLLSLAKAVENRYTTVDLRNEISVTGLVKEVDGSMNMTLNEAAVFNSNGKYTYCPIMFIQARQIRNIHIPTNVNIIRAVKDQVEYKPKEKKKVDKRRTFKQSRLKKQQEETLKLIKDIKAMKEKIQKEKGQEN